MSESWPLLPVTDDTLKKQDHVARNHIPHFLLRSHSQKHFLESGFLKMEVIQNIMPLLLIDVNNYNDHMYYAIFIFS